ncbi:hypothetical protein KY290_038341 [Solanum tuberosum]|uniref:Zinc finger GRF-type domain-containing protein n=1 Tax=Solanum tuberosum TaxID=4113 RepID=A0ABQ7TZV8_SOLTU|nr:hypothetical protein KY289_036181 [Solanum tuberosum]KAH0641072.1 hypothetical protein KY285_037658 [Solanum tuberosum]KAH0739636.1 hypothetical protein KY290_038341 [Solanum tuberosum]
MFGDQGRSAKQTAIISLMNTKMVEGTLVIDHALKMIGLLNELEVSGAEIDNDSQIEMILQFLPNSFQQFFLNYNMNKTSLSLAQLLNELQAAEALFKKQAPSMALNIEKGSTSKPQGGQKKKKKSHKANAIAPPTGGVKKPKGKCFHSKMSDHWKTHFPVFLAKKKNNPGNSLSVVVETFLADVSTTSWCVDSGVTDHICTTLQGFQKTRKLIRAKEMSNLTISTSSDANVFCRCGVNAGLKTSWTQLIIGHQFFFCCKNIKRRGGCDYFQWYDDEIPPQAKKIIWGLLKRIKFYEQERKQARKIRIICVIALIEVDCWSELTCCDGLQVCGWLEPTGWLELGGWLDLGGWLKLGG